MSPDIHTLSGAYVLDAIEPDERAAFEAHLAECESCREEVDALRAAAATLGDPAQPPPGLRSRVLALAEQTPQLPPLVDHAPVVRRRWVPRLLAAAAAVVLLAGIGIGLRNASDEPDAVTASQVFSASDARRASVPLGDGEVRVALSKDLGRLAVDGADMPAPPTGKAYQLWLLHDGHATSLSVMEGDETSAVEEIPTAGVLAVTVENSGGAKAPTGDPILTLDPKDL